ncbi:MAG TPA: ATP-binding protein [Pseudonocardiaceae bacterium]|nr:ATP-binding protein [Pseudonocardiaceae bacterium]
MTTRRLRVHEWAGAGAAIAYFTTSLAQDGGLTGRQAYRLRLAADEITANIIHHGYHGRPGMLELEGAVADDRLWLRIVDTAPRFDPRTHDPTPRLDADPVEAREEGGFGLYLALQALDEFAYEYRAGHNHNVLIMCRPAQGATETGGKGGNDDGEHRTGRRRGAWHHRHRTSASAAGGRVPDQA